MTSHVVSWCYSELSSSEGRVEGCSGGNPWSVLETGCILHMFRVILNIWTSRWRRLCWATKRGSEHFAKNLSSYHAFGQKISCIYRKIPVQYCFLGLHSVGFTFTVNVCMFSNIVTPPCSQLHFTLKAIHESPTQVCHTHTHTHRALQHLRYKHDMHTHV